MLRPTAIQVTPQKDYFLDIIFNNGEKGALMSGRISAGNGMGSWESRIISVRQRQTALLSCGPMVRISVRTSCMI